MISYEFVLDMVEVEHSETEKRTKKKTLQINNQQLQIIKDEGLLCVCEWMKYYT